MKRHEMAKNLYTGSTRNTDSQNLAKHATYLVLILIILLPFAVSNAFSKYKAYNDYRDSNCQNAASANAVQPCQKVSMNVVHKLKKHNKHGVYWFLSLQAAGTNSPQLIELVKDDNSSSFITDDNRLYNNVHIGDIV